MVTWQLAFWLLMPLSLAIQQWWYRRYWYKQTIEAEITIAQLLEERAEFVRENGELKHQLAKADRILNTRFVTGPPEPGLDCCDECGDCSCETIRPPSEGT
jgi:hypothetical protein